MNSDSTLGSHEPSFDSSGNSDAVLTMVHQELSSKRRWIYRFSLVAASASLAVLLSLWLTEPRPLPLRLHMALGTMSAIAIGWIGVFSWILLRRDCPSSMDRIATSWMAMLACTVLLCVGLGIAWSRRSMTATLALVAVGIPWLLLTVWVLRAAYRQRSQRQAALRDREST